MDTAQMGLAVIALGGGRKVQSDVLDPSAGFTLYKKVGDPVEPGDYVELRFKVEKLGNTDLKDVK